MSEMAVSVRTLHASPIQWPRVAGWSGTLGLHFLVVALMLVPAAMVQVARRATTADPVVHIIMPPASEKPPPVLPKPQPLQHRPLPVAVHATPIRSLPQQPLTEMAAVGDAVAQVVPSLVHATAAVADAPPRAIGYGNRTQLPYPRDALRNHEQGTVLLRVLVAADGKVQSVEIEQGSGSRSLDRAAREAVLRWQFAPAMRNGVAHGGWALVPITFNLDRL